MGICVTWVEGEELAIELMMKKERSTVKPKRMECTMRLGSIWGELNYLRDEQGRYHEMWMLYYEARGNEITHYWPSDARTEGHELMRLGKLPYRTRRRD